MSNKDVPCLNFFWFLTIEMAHLVIIDFSSTTNLKQMQGKGRNLCTIRNKMIYKEILYLYRYSCLHFWQWTAKNSKKCGMYSWFFLIWPVFISVNNINTFQIILFKWRKVVHWKPQILRRKKKTFQGANQKWNWLFLTWLVFNGDKHNK